ncbi:MAG TPA: hypothetical protein VL860_11105, partial [Planctomycetota bacterium]|nr:hypothetical protein [Planctomycetota bacterium]
VWSLPEPAPVANVTAGALWVEKQHLESLTVNQKVDLETVTAKIAEDRNLLEGFQARADAFNLDAAAPPAEVNPLEDRVAQLNREIDSLEAQERAARVRQDLASGQLREEIILKVNDRLIKLNEDSTHFFCGTLVEGWYYTTVKNGKPTTCRLGRGSSDQPMPAQSARAVNHPNLTAWCLAPGTGIHKDGRPTGGFAVEDYERAPQDGMQVFCVCHQVVGDKVLENSVVSGVMAGSVSLNGHPFYKLSMPMRPEMAGAPVVTPQGKLIGLLMPKSKDVEDLNLVMPVYEITQTFGK